ncbi:metallophosphoesterase family protein [Bacillus sp. USDA818B3_A]|uniref:metallophosphoesterase family protein n=1 Tax=Bacillus sp. USDA818B3_A TaxID=2698834 RepID=UPI00136E7C8C|nr:YfcE family phosphodiesterase [Bacillus sp. USDA818B3_A]
MKLAFISDIHGNAVALDAVLKDIEKRGVDKIYVLGDICFRGIEPKRSIDFVRQLDTDVIKGNADEWVVRGVEKGEVPDPALEIMNKEREWTLSQLDDESIEYLRNLPMELKIEIDNIRIHAFHATPNSLFDVVLPDESDDKLKEKLMEKEADVYIFAHIHRPFIRYLKGKCIINTGSVGLPFDGVNKASYAFVIIEKENIDTSIVRVDFNRTEVINKLNNSDYPNTQLLKNILNFVG